jgi:rRNA maturation endonuclease Nob1
MTKLKCKPCNLVYKDDGSVSVCKKCGGELKRIKVHRVKIKNLTIFPKNQMGGG